jgi:hypothetical protein
LLEDGKGGRNIRDVAPCADHYGDGHADHRFLALRLRLSVVGGNNFDAAVSPGCGDRAPNYGPAGADQDVA